MQAWKWNSSAWALRQSDSCLVHWWVILLQASRLTNERRRLISVIPYYQAGQGLMVRKGTEEQFKDLKSLEGRRVAVQIGTTGAELAKCIKASISSAEAFMDLKMNGVDAVITRYVRSLGTLWLRILVLKGIGAAEGMA